MKISDYSMIGVGVGISLIALSHKKNKPKSNWKALLISGIITIALGVLIAFGVIDF
jgi:uncharacterized membrane protein HdeD (DUF308 family)